MTKAQLQAAVMAVKGDGKEALQEIYDTLNQGQKKKILKYV